jgi:hypothetical protein
MASTYSRRRMRNNALDLSLSDADNMNRHSLGWLPGLIAVITRERSFGEQARAWTRTGPGLSWSDSELACVQSDQRPEISIFATERLVFCSARVCATRK